MSDLPTRTVKRITRRIIPFLFILYLVAYLDRVNVSFAALEMTRDLGMTNEAFGFGAGIFFLGYFLLEIPGAVLVEVWSARKWIARIMITWGILSALTGMVRNANEFYIIRFCLGLAEAGFFPGMIVYLSHWYRGVDRAKAVASFMNAIPASEIIGAPVSAYLMTFDWMWLAGWRWLLILEGIPAVVLGVVTLFYLTDRPKDAKWLKDDERDWITRELAAENVGRTSHAHILNGLKDGRVLLLLGAYFALMNVSYALVMWLPKILKATYGHTTFTTTLLTSVPFLVATPMILWIGWHSDKVRERRWHAAGPLLCCAAAMLAMRAQGIPLLLAVGLFAIAVAGMQSAKGPIWAIATTLLAGKAAAASIGLINSFGNLGGFFGPYSVGWLSSRTDGFNAGLLYIAGAAVVAATLVLIAGWLAMRPRPVAEEAASVVSVKT
ncbi:MAG TPA: MFS transporter [Bryobacteraceae bacterium]|nr:MFS transporter [Bryobacteraceae bacterium]